MILCDYASSPGQPNLKNPELLVERRDLSSNAMALFFMVLSAHLRTSLRICANDLLEVPRSKSCVGVMPRLGIVRFAAALRSDMHEWAIDEVPRTS